MFAAHDTVQPSEDLYKENFKTVIDWLTKKHDFKLRADDPDGIGYVYYDTFFKGGPYLNYSFGSGGGMGGGNSPTYEQLMLTHDGTGKNRGYLASDESFAFMRTSRPGTSWFRSSATSAVQRPSGPSGRRQGSRR
jgi:hypothetical protein